MHDNVPAGEYNAGTAMEFNPADFLSYKRSRFQTRLPIGRLYTASHFWLAEQEPGVWRVGFTRFATRMLGDIVESGFETKPGEPVQTGQVIGWMEGFKALSDLFCAADGTFVAGNPALDSDSTLIDKKPYGEGWLYEVRGTPDTNSMSVEKYAELLDTTIDKMM